MQFCVLGIVPTGRLRALLRRFLFPVRVQLWCRMNPRARARERDGLWSTCALLTSRKSLREKKERALLTNGKMRFEPGVPWPAPPLWRSLYLGLYLVSNPPEKRNAMLVRRVIVALLSSQSVLLSLCSRRPCSPPEHKRDRERKERVM